MVTDYNGCIDVIAKIHLMSKLPPLTLRHWCRVCGDAGAPAIEAAKAKTFLGVEKAGWPGVQPSMWVHC